MIEWYNNRYANFSGRANRSEYGYYILFNLVIVLVIFLMSVLTKNELTLFFNLCIFLLIMFVPTAAVTIRRLKDLGIRLNLFLLFFMPFFNFFFLIYLLITPGQRGENQYGQDPKIRPQIIELD